MPIKSETSDYASRHGFDTRVGAYCVLIERNSILLAHLHPDVFGRGREGRDYERVGSG